MRTQALTCLVLVTLSVVARSDEQPGAVYRADDVFTLVAMQAYGGVILQAEARFKSPAGAIIPVGQLRLGIQNETPCVIHDSVCYAIPESREVVARMATWVARNRTGLFSFAHVTSSTRANTLRTSDLVPAMRPYVRQRCSSPEAPCYVAKEFQNTPQEETLFDMDFTQSVTELPADRLSAILSRLNGRRGAVRSCASPVNESYLNTDVDSQFVATLVSPSQTASGQNRLKPPSQTSIRQPSASAQTGRLSIIGVPYRYSWLECPRATLPFITDVQQLVTASSGDRRHNDAIRFARIIAILRAFEHSPTNELRNLM